MWVWKASLRSLLTFFSYWSPLHEHCVAKGPTEENILVYSIKWSGTRPSSSSSKKKWTNKRKTATRDTTWWRVADLTTERHCWIKYLKWLCNKTENPFSLKDDKREMTRKTKPMSTTKLTNTHDNFGNSSKELLHTLIKTLTTFINNFDNSNMQSIQFLKSIWQSRMTIFTIPNDSFDNCLSNSNNNY